MKSQPDFVALDNPMFINETPNNFHQAYAPNDGTSQQPSYELQNFLLHSQQEPLNQLAFHDISYPASRGGSDKSNSVDSYKFHDKQWKGKRPVPSKLRQSRNHKKGENKTVAQGGSNGAVRGDESQGAAINNNNNKPQNQLNKKRLDLLIQNTAPFLQSNNEVTQKQRTMNLSSHLHSSMNREIIQPQTSSQVAAQAQQHTGGLKGSAAPSSIMMM